MSFDFSTLITDRTVADVERARQLNAKAIETMTAEELAEFIAGLKGAYNVSDLNRVGACVAALTQLLHDVGINVTTSPKNDWLESDFPTPRLLNAYLADIAALRAAITMPAAAPTVPLDLDDPTTQEVNNIERILQLLEASLQTMKQTFVPCGEALCGGEYL